MAQLSTKIKLYLAANSVNSVDFTSDVLLQDDSNGEGPYIKAWNVSGVAQPTDEQLAAYDTAGNTQESNLGVDSTRRTEYGDLGAQLDELYHDIDAGKFGDTAKTSAWYVRVKQIKTDNPKA